MATLEGRQWWCPGPWDPWDPPPQVGPSLDLLKARLLDILKLIPSIQPNIYS